MTDRQVEVVPGRHLVASCSGAVIVVAHRDSTPPSRDSPSYVALKSLLELIVAARMEGGDRFGPALARIIGSWAASAGADTSFGIIAPTADGIAILLRGTVGATIYDDDGSETLHGTGSLAAPRIENRPVPARAVLYVVDAGASPDVPARRGIGSLEEGVALGAAAVVWTAVAAPVRPIAAALDRPASPAQLKPPSLFETLRAEDQAPPRRAPLPVKQPTPPGRPPASTPRARPLAPQVHGIRCARKHFNNPGVAFCRQCGLRMNQTKVLSVGPRPPLGFLVLDDGTTITLVRDLVIGREPETSPAAQGDVIPIRLANHGGVLSRAHAAIRLVEWDVTVVDLGSTNGTFVKSLEQQVWQPIPPNKPHSLTRGTEIQFGGANGRRATFDSPHAHY